MIPSQFPAFLIDGSPFAVYSTTMDQNPPRSRHRHEAAQVLYMQSGLAIIEGSKGRWTVLPRQVAWIAPNAWHMAEAHGHLTGWSAYPPPQMCVGLPDEPCVLRVSPLVPLIMERAVTWPSNQELNPAQARLIRVFMDELAHPQSMCTGDTSEYLPFPHDERLMHVAAQILDDPASKRSMGQWAAFANMSERSLSRHFAEETGLSFSRWQQTARLHKARELLADGSNVQECAWSLGYENVSAFISAFKHMFSQTPAQHQKGGQAPASANFGRAGKPNGFSG